MISPFLDTVIHFNYLLFHFKYLFSHFNYHAINRLLKPIWSVKVKQITQIGQLARNFNESSHLNPSSTPSHRDHHRSATTTSPHYHRIATTTSQPSRLYSTIPSKDRFQVFSGGLSTFDGNRSDSILSSTWYNCLHCSNVLTIECCRYFIV